MKPTFKDYCIDNEEEIIDDIVSKIDEINLPSHVNNQLHNVIDSYSYDILEAKYNEACDNYDEQKYEQKYEENREGK